MPVFVWHVFYDRVVRSTHMSVVVLGTHFVWDVPVLGRRPEILTSTGGWLLDGTVL